MTTSSQHSVNWTIRTEEFSASLSYDKIIIMKDILEDVLDLRRARGRSGVHFL